MSAPHLHARAQASEGTKKRQLAVPGVLELQESLYRENEQLRTALSTRIVIEQAKGMLAERFEMHVDEAFERLRGEARTRQMKLHALAAAITTREAWAEAIFVRPRRRDAPAQGNGRLVP